MVRFGGLKDSIWAPKATLPHNPPKQKSHNVATASTTKAEDAAAAGIRAPLRIAAPRKSNSSSFPCHLEAHLLTSMQRIPRLQAWLLHLPQVRPVKESRLTFVVDRFLMFRLTCVVSTLPQLEPSIWFRLLQEFVHT